MKKFPPYFDAGFLFFVISALLAIAGKMLNDDVLRAWSISFMILMGVIVALGYVCEVLSILNTPLQLEVITQPIKDVRWVAKVRIDRKNGRVHAPEEAKDRILRKATLMDVRNPQMFRAPYYTSHETYVEILGQIYLFEGDQSL